jgi:SAM-dependent methyltransferase
MDRDVNLEAYASIGQRSSYKTRESLLAYRSARIGRYTRLVDFIRRRSGKQLSVLEVGSGSSALLYALARGGVLAQGTGIELSRSRTEFADLWKRDDGYGMVRNVNSNFTDVAIESAVWDWFIVIDNTFTYLHPEESEYPTRLLRAAYDGLRDDGRLLIDFINYAKRDRGVDYRQWCAFPSADPYSWGLYSNRIDGEMNRCESIFIKSDGTESRKVEVSKVYTLEEISHLLGSCGFLVDEVVSSFDGEPFVESESERLVVVGKKKG